MLMGEPTIKRLGSFLRLLASDMDELTLAV
jgi:hypothetical protein